MSKCRKCGLDHERLGVEIDGDTLIRLADADRHMLKMSGGAWSFDAALFDGHPEIEMFIVRDRDSGREWKATREDFTRGGFDLMLAGKAQRALALRHWNKDTEKARELGRLQLSPRVTIAEQARLF